MFTISQVRPRERCQCYLLNKVGSRKQSLYWWENEWYHQDNHFQNDIKKKNGQPSCWSTLPSSKLALGRFFIDQADSLTNPGNKWRLIQPRQIHNVISKIILNSLFFLKEQKSMIIWLCYRYHQISITAQYPTPWIFSEIPIAILLADLLCMASRQKLNQNKITFSPYYSSPVSEVLEDKGSRVIGKVDNRWESDGAIESKPYKPRQYNHYQY